MIFQALETDYQLIKFNILIGKTYVADNPFKISHKKSKSISNLFKTTNILAKFVVSILHCEGQYTVVYLKSLLKNIVEEIALSDPFYISFVG